MHVDSEPALPRLIDIPGIMRLTNLSRPTIYRYIKSGEIKPFKFGRRTMFSEAHIASWIEHKMGQAA